MKIKVKIDGVEVMMPAHYERKVAFGLMTERLVPDEDKKFNFVELEGGGWEGTAK